MASTDDLAARSWAGGADSLPPGEPVLPVHRGRAADRCRGCVIKLPPPARSARWGWHPVAWPGLTKVRLGRMADLRNAGCVPRGRGVPKGR
jgi:hypothetical protein